MDRTLITFSAPNLITIPLMAFGGFLLLGIIWQVMLRTGIVGTPGGAMTEA